MGHPDQHAHAVYGCPTAKEGVTYLPFSATHHFLYEVTKDFSRIFGQCQQCRQLPTRCEGRAVGPDYGRAFYANTLPIGS